MAELFTWKGLDSQGKEITVQNLTWEEVQGMEVQEKEYLAKKEQIQSQQQTDAKLAPVVNKAVSDYAKSKGITQADLSGTWQPKQYAQGGETVPGMNGQADSTAVPGQAIARATDPVSKAFADLSTSSEEGPPIPTTENGMLEGPPAPKGAALGSIVNVGAPVTAGMAAEAQQPAPTQPKGSLASMLDDIPDEVAQPLLIQYHNGVIKPDEFFKQVVAIKKSLLTLKQEKELAEAKMRPVANSGFGSSSMGAALAFTKEHPEMVQKGLDVVEALRKEGKYSDVLLDGITASLSSNVVRGLQDLNALQGKTESAVRTLEETTPGLIGLAAGKTAASQEAAARGVKKLDQKDEDFITSTRSAYDDIAYAKTKFDPNFMTPYIGRAIKISAMKQLSSAFADFIGSVEKGTATYRKQNFGMAQTGTELANLKDVIDKDMSVKPEVFMTQINKFLDTAERDYKDRVKLLSAQKYIIPPGYESIGIKGGMAQSAPVASFNSEADVIAFAKSHGLKTVRFKIGDKTGTWSE